MKLSGTKDLEIELSPDKSSVRLTLQFASAYEAAIAYDEVKTAAKTGRLKINLGTGEILEEECGS